MAGYPRKRRKGGVRERRILQELGELVLPHLVDGQCVR